MHSWRVLILPFLEGEEIYEKYRFDEPWDGPNNRKLHGQMPEIYRCPCSKELNRTHYKLVCGPGTLFADGLFQTLGECPDGTSNTALVVEDAGSPVNWLKPDDLTVDEAVELFSNFQFEDFLHRRDSLFSVTYGSSCFGMMDGSVGHLGVNCDPDELRNLFGSDNGVPDFEALDPRKRSITRPKYGPIVAAVIYAILWSLPLGVILFSPARNDLEDGIRSESGE